MLLYCPPKKKSLGQSTQPHGYFSVAWYILVRVERVVACSWFHKLHAFRERLCGRRTKRLLEERKMQRRVRGHVVKTPAYQFADHNSHSGLASNEPTAVPQVRT